MRMEGERVWLSEEEGEERNIDKGEADRRKRPRGGDGMVEGKSHVVVMVM